MCNQSHFWAANYKDLFQTGQSFLSKCEKFPKETAFFTGLITDLLHFMTFHGLFSTNRHYQQSCSWLQSQQIVQLSCTQMRLVQPL